MSTRTPPVSNDFLNDGVELHLNTLPADHSSDLPYHLLFQGLFNEDGMMRGVYFENRQVANTVAISDEGVTHTLDHRDASMSGNTDWLS